MNETRYLISEAARLTQVEAHVLRYWEEELELSIGRNEMGHRYYTEKDIQTFMDIKELKKKGLQLRAIKEKIHKEDQLQMEQPAERKADSIKSEEEPVEPETEVLNDMEENSEEGITKEEKFTRIMERLLQDIRRSERKEGRYRRVDEAIRRHQQSRKMVAVTEDFAGKKKRKR